MRYSISEFLPPDSSLYSGITKLKLGLKLSPKSLEKKVEETAGDIGRGAKKAGEAVEGKAGEIGHDIKKGAKKIRKKL